MISVDRSEQYIRTDIEFASGNQERIMYIFLHNTSPPTIGRRLFNNRLDLVKVFCHLNPMSSIRIFTRFYDPDVPLRSCSLKKLRLVVSTFFWRIARQVVIILFILNSFSLKLLLLLFVFYFIFKFLVSLSEPMKLRVIQPCFYMECQRNISENILSKSFIIVFHVDI